MSDPQPRHTRIPNAILDSMAELTEPELRVLLIITRKTIGWQKECDLLSLSQLEECTGLSRPAVNKALHTAIERGWVECTGRGKQNTGCYRLSPRLVNDVNQLSELTSKQGLLTSVNDVNRSTPELVNDVNTQNKDSKEKKERVSAARKTRQRTPPKEPKEPTPAPIIQALADVCIIDRSIATKTDHIILAEAAGALYRSGKGKGKTDEEIISAIQYFGKWFKTNDWRGKKGDAPTPDLVRKLWPQAIAARAAPTNGHLPPVVERKQRPTPAETAAAAQQYDPLKKWRERQNNADQ